MALTPVTARDPKWGFLESTFLTSARRDALVTRGSGKLYEPTCTDTQRQTVQRTIDNCLRELALVYVNSVDEEAHIRNIGALASRVSETCCDSLTNRLTFGIAQKLLNSYLKYLWCAGRIVLPPHCPFDSIIIGKLGKLPPNCEWRWTRASEEDYRAWVSAAKPLAGQESLGEWELRVWNG